MSSTASTDSSSADNAKKEQAEKEKAEKEQLMEQYKAYLQMIDHSTDHRLTTNQFFLSINSFLVTLFLGTGGYMLATEKKLLWLLFPLAIAGYYVSRVWHFLLTNYTTIHSAKWKVVNDMEERLSYKMEEKLSYKPFYSEWHDMKKRYDMPKGFAWLRKASDASSKQERLYYSISLIESELPKLFGRMYVALGTITALILVYSQWIHPNSCSIFYFFQYIWHNLKGLVIAVLILVVIAVVYVTPIRLPNKRKKSEKESAEDS